MPGRLILASGSSSRVQLLAQVDVVPDLVVSANVDESIVKGEKLSELAIRLASNKATKVAKNFPGEFVLGADTVVACGNRQVEKTRSKLKARRNLEMLSGKRRVVKVFPDLEKLLVRSSVMSQY